MTTVKIGDFFVDSWGYEQTNVDWYQVTKVSPASVWLRRVKSDRTETGYMTGECVPVKNAFIGDEKRKKLRQNSGHFNVPSDYGWCQLWDGRPKRYSSYA